MRRRRGPRTDLTTLKSPPAIDPRMSAVSEFQDGVERVEEAYEFMIAYAGQGIGREVQTRTSGDVREYLVQLSEGLEDALDAAGRIPAEFDLAGAAHYDGVLEEMAREREEANDVLELLAAQDRITSQQVDNINGMSVFQSVMMKLFFLDELTKHLDYE